MIVLCICDTSFETFIDNHVMSNQEMFEMLSEKIDKIASNIIDDSSKIDSSIKNDAS